MAFWQQNDANGWPRNGTAPRKNQYPRSVPVYDHARIPLAMENPGSTLPSDGFSAQPSYVAVNVSFGEHDGLQGALMRVAQADTWNAAPNPWPAAGTWEQPGGPIAASRITRLQPTTSAHFGLSSATGAGPTMLFVTPPVFTVQTRPILATGI
jgi:hypothetical protein